MSETSEMQGTRETRVNTPEQYAEEARRIWTDNPLSCIAEEMLGKMLLNRLVELWPEMAAEVKLVDMPGVGTKVCSHGVPIDLGRVFDTETWAGPFDDTDLREELKAHGLIKGSLRCRVQLFDDDSVAGVEWLAVAP